MASNKSSNVPQKAGLANQKEQSKASIGQAHNQRSNPALSPFGQINNSSTPHITPMGHLKAFTPHEQAESQAAKEKLSKNT